MMGVWEGSYSWCSVPEIQDILKLMTLIYMLWIRMSYLRYISNIWTKIQGGLLTIHGHFSAVDICGSVVLSFKTILPDLSCIRWYFSFLQFSFSLKATSQILLCQATKSTYWGVFQHPFKCKRSVSIMTQVAHDIVLVSITRFSVCVFASSWSLSSCSIF